MTMSSARPPDLPFDGALLGVLAAAARRARDTLVDADQARWQRESRAAVSWAGGFRDRYDDAAKELDARSQIVVAMLEALVTAAGRAGVDAEDGAIRRSHEQADWDAAAAAAAAVAATPAPVGAG